MPEDLMILIAAAASIAFFHTVFGPDHYLPFIMMAGSGKWSIRKTAVVTFFCGLGHVISSVILGFLGIMLGVAVSQLEAVESVRGDIAVWALIAFGLVYFVWGIRRALRNKPHTHIHSHIDGDEHVHTHTHMEHHSHVHKPGSKKKMTPWVLFVIFVLGPCEPLIPLLMYPAAKNSIPAVILVSGIFGAVTITTMLGIVLISCFGFHYVPSARLERYTHAIAGATISLCGLSILMFGL